MKNVFKKNCKNLLKELIIIVFGFPLGRIESSEHSIAKMKFFSLGTNIIRWPPSCVRHAQLSGHPVVFVMRNQMAT
jgi:hypothetical protein